MTGLKKAITDFHYGKKSFFFFVLFFIPTVFYTLPIVIKNFVYKIGILKEKKVNAKVICIGNLTTGGVGKTPVVIEIANYLSRNPLNKVAILSRGYQGKLDNKNPNLVKNFDEILINDSYLTGDEVNLIAKKTSSSAVVTCKDRVFGANFAIEKLGANIIILDDGFSNRKIHKDLNIILVDSKRLFGNGSLLPLGPLREPVFEINRADYVIVVDKNEGISKKTESFLNSLKIPFGICTMKKGNIYNIKTNKPLENVSDIVAFSGIGSPEQFYYNLRKDFNLVETMSFDDHIEYNQEIVDRIVELKNSTKTQAILTTEKDAVKLLEFDNIDDIYAFALAPEIDVEKIFQL